jgi:hypothetical protein
MKEKIDRFNKESPIVEASTVIFKALEILLYLKHELDLKVNET